MSYIILRRLACLLLEVWGLLPAFRCSVGVVPYAHEVFMYLGAVCSLHLIPPQSWKYPPPRALFWMYLTEIFWILGAHQVVADWFFAWALLQDIAGLSQSQVFRPSKKLSFLSSFLTMCPVCDFLNAYIYMATFECLNFAKSFTSTFLSGSVVIQLLNSCSTLCNLMDLKHTRLLCPPLYPRVCLNACPLSQWCYLNISSTATHFPFCLLFFSASGSCPKSQLFASGVQSTEASALASSPITSWQIEGGKVGIVTYFFLLELKYHSRQGLQTWNSKMLAPWK